MCLLTSGSAASMAITNSTQIRLPTHIKPEHYDVFIKPDLKDFVFSGTVSILVDVTQTSEEICLHSLELEVTDVTLAAVSGEALPAPASMTSSPDFDFLHLRWAAPLPAGKYLLGMKFAGKLTDQMAGLYRSEYKSASGEKRYLAVTQFEATDARRAFPCWDEPSFKATFSVTVDVPADLVALSNMPVTGEKPSSTDGRKVVAFDRSPRMSTYLLALFVGEAEYVEDVTRAGVPVRVYTPIGLKDQGLFGLQVARDALDFFAEFFSTPYPLPKLDLIAVPDFAAGAMENWGLVTFREIYLLCHEQRTSARARQELAYVVCHELAHMWFGNLVTMDWWTHLWLNEGFATYVGWLAVDKLFPEWDIWTQFMFTEQGEAMSMDALQSSHPVEVPVTTTAQINQIFDPISYSKGATLIRMLATHMGPQEFQTGLSHYIKKFTYQNTETNDLWEAMSTAVSGLDLTSMMNDWIRITGYPVVTVTPGEAGALTVQQDLYLASGAASGCASLWTIPLLTTSLNAPGPLQQPQLYAKGPVLAEKTQPLTGTAAPPMKLNRDGIGFYRVNYHPTLVAGLISAIAENPTTAFAHGDLVNLVKDFFALAASGHSSIKHFLDLLQALRGASVGFAWEAIAATLGALRSLWFEQSPEVVGHLNRFAAGLFGPHSEAAIWDTGVSTAAKDHIANCLRSTFVANACRAGHEWTVAEAQRRFSSLVNATPEAAANSNPEVQAAILETGVRLGGLPEWEQTLAFFQREQVPDLKVRALFALGQSVDPVAMDKNFELIFSGSVRLQDVFHLMRSLSYNPVTRRRTWDFVRNNWAKFYEMFSPSGFLLGRIVSNSCESLSTLKDAEEVKSFFDGIDKKQYATIDSNVKLAVEEITNNAKCIERIAGDLNAWLAAQ